MKSWSIHTCTHIPPFNTVVSELEGSTPLIPKPATGRGPEPVSSISDPHNPLKIHLKAIFLVFQVDVSSPKIFMHSLYPHTSYMPGPSYSPDFTLLAILSDRYKPLSLVQYPKLFTCCIHYHLYSILSCSLAASTITCTVS
jgi:hypothetical protein